MRLKPDFVAFVLVEVSRRGGDDLEVHRNIWVGNLPGALVRVSAMKNTARPDIYDYQYLYLEKWVNGTLKSTKKYVII